MKASFSFLLALNCFFGQSQINGELSLGVLQSIDKNKWQLVNSSFQGVGVSAYRTLRFANPGIRARVTLLKPLSKSFSAVLSTGLVLRREESLWSPNTFTYFSLPLQAGVNYLLILQPRANFSISAYSGVNIFKIKDQLASRQTGLLHNAEISYTLKKNGFIKSWIFKTGYELEVDNEFFFYRSTGPPYIDENFHYKITRNQIYIALGVGI